MDNTVNFVYFHAIKKTKTCIVETRKYSYTLPLSPNFKQMATESSRSGAEVGKCLQSWSWSVRWWPSGQAEGNEVLLPTEPLS